MMALALWVIVSVLPELAKLALPELTVPPVGLARLCPVERPKQAATDSAISLGLKSPRCLSLALELDMATPPLDFIPAAKGKLILDLRCRRGNGRFAQAGNLHNWNGQ